MNRVIVIIVHSRIDNIRTWARCWNTCEQICPVIVIHNVDKKEDCEPMATVCKEAGFLYYARMNKGFDIGAFQDVINDRLPVPGFPEWDELLWITDDVFPMQKNFAAMFFSQLPEVGVVCMEISPYAYKHIRTTGFAIRKEVAKRLKFPAEIITTKAECYHFEHRGGKETFMDQITAMGLKVIMAAPKESSPLWDTGYHRKLPRMAEFERAFPKPQKVLFICPAYEKYPVIISSLLAQTHQDWELWLIHDGECKWEKEIIGQAFSDKRIFFQENLEHAGKWGHTIRRDCLQKAKERSDIDYVVITNADNYHTPVYCEYMLKGFAPTVVATYCSDMVHSYKAWQVIPCRMERGYVDCAGVMIRKEAACEVGWKDTESHSADWVYFTDVIKKYGIRNFKPVKGCLLIHN